MLWLFLLLAVVVVAALFSSAEKSGGAGEKVLGARCPLCDHYVTFTFSQAYREESFPCPGCGVPINLTRPKRSKSGTKVTATYVPNKKAEKAYSSKKPLTEPSQESVMPETPANCWPIKVDLSKPVITDDSTPSGVFYDVSNMPYWKWPDRDIQEMYSLEGIYRDLATAHILYLNQYIKEASSILNRNLGVLEENLIAWEPYAPNSGLFTWLEKRPLTPSGKIPKYEFCLHYMAAIHPLRRDQIYQRPENYIFGDIYYQKSNMGKAETVIWQGRYSIVLNIKIASGQLKLWKIEYGDVGEDKNIIRI